MLYVLNDWFLLEVEKYINQLQALLALSELWCLIRQFLDQLQQLYLSITSIPLWRLIFLVLKRLIGVIKAGLKYFLIDLPIPALEFFYVLHLARAFLTLINFFKDTDNKNLVERTKFLYACFKILISCLMFSFLILLFVYGMAPLGVVAYAHLKNLFRVYTFSKFGISLLTLGFSYYRAKSYRDDAAHAWLQANYQANIQKHTHILVLGISIAVLLTLVSVCGFGLGPIGLAVVIVLAGLLLIIDIAKAIYFYKNGCDVPEPQIGSLPQHNSLLDFSKSDYYYRKCRVGRLKIIDDAEESSEANRVYLLKEIVLKIIQLEAKLKNSSSRIRFFSEKQKIQEKIEGLKQEGSLLLKGDDEENKLLPSKIIKALNEDYQQLKPNDKTLIPKKDLENLMISNAIAILNDLHARGVIREEKKVEYSQPFRQSFFRKKGDCEDIRDACQELLKQQKPNYDIITLRPSMATGRIHARIG
ncbi:hypothetical protein A1D18_00780 [Candidatus Rickettsiella isopodorum]|jgi:hypothetical protein|uniref:Uncharacterized protein n=1 Tax=Candidatus Rickettsiella isopodorum TaxID=1225476 RepID=A0A1J8PAT0_9COXI|nr:hypothetical protein [Candidatus Rickettsiella isopodorum]OIZ96131.1 hypothetical protein A1D18_00780 [Candidatus Rickettsiella isopodorum]